jgi:hypothetical protein
MVLKERGASGVILLINLTIAILALATGMIEFTGKLPIQKTFIHNIFSSNPLVTNISVSSGRYYSLFPDEIRRGGRVYMDRRFTIKQMPPALNSALFIPTYNSDKDSNGDSFLTFYTTRDVEIYIGYDSRFSSIPAWLDSNFERTTKEIEVGVVENPFSLTLYKNSFFKNKKIILGGNREDDHSIFRSMYLVIIKEI